MRSPQVTLLLLVSLRVVCVPLMMTCNLAPTDRGLPVIINTDWGFTLLMFVFAFSDGYIVNMAMMFGPKAGSERDQEVVAGFLVAVITSAITFGAIFSIIVVQAL